MKYLNIYEDNPILEVHSDERGVIADVFFNAEIDHVAMITSKPHAIRGNHYHAKSVQSILIVSGSLEYWFADKDSPDKSDYRTAKTGDLLTSEASEIHALKIGPDGCTFIAFSSGERGGSNYEDDTYRVSNIIKSI
jgi:hypothetical protein